MSSCGECSGAPQILTRRRLLQAGAAGAAALYAGKLLDLDAVSKLAFDSVRAPTAAAESLPRSIRTVATRLGAPVPHIVTRAQWGANESLRHGAPSFDGHVEKIVVHHTGTPNGLRDWAAQVRQIYEFETSHGYQDIAYHYLVDPNGTVYEGRWARNFGHHVPDATNGRGGIVRGGHAINHNDRTIGIALIGDYMKTTVSPAMLASTVALGAWLCARFGVDPLGASPYRTPFGAEHLPNICPHGSTSATQCPGLAVLADLPALRERIAQRIGSTHIAGGYWIVAPDGRELAFGAVPRLSRRGPTPQLAGVAAHPSGKGYWAYARDGGVFAFGAAPFRGSLGGSRHLNAPVVGMAPTLDGRGYWLAAADGGVFAFGSARYHGSVAKHALHAPIAGITATPSGDGYWLFAADGGVFAFGDARFYGSMTRGRLSAPIVAMAAAEHGYWLTASDGGVFAFGHAQYHGSAANLTLSGDVVSIAASSTGRGYLLLTSDGEIIPFGDAPYHGSARGQLPTVIGVAGHLTPHAHAPARHTRKPPAKHVTGPKHAKPRAKTPPKRKPKPKATRKTTRKR